nr:putative acetyltransferase [Megavirus caiporensis]
MTNLSMLEKLMKNFLSKYTFSNKEYFVRTKIPKFTHDIILKKFNQNKYGICMDLNYVFYTILKKHGFNCYLVKAYEQKPDGYYYNIYHLTIVVMINNCKYLADVGFGKYFTKPILLENNIKTDNINVRIIDTNNLDIYHGERLIVRMYDQPVTDIKDINNNYQNFFKSTAEDFPLCRKLYERIYDPKINKYIPPKNKNISLIQEKY